MLKVLLLLAPLTLPSMLFGQQANGDAPVDRAALQVFTNEVRQLRITVEQTLSVLPRMQLLTARFQMQQDRVDRLTRELQDFHSQLESAADSRKEIVNNLKWMEASNLTDPGQRQQLEEQKTFLRARLEQATAQEQEKQIKELALSTGLQREKAVLCDLEEKLGALEKKLEGIR